MGDVVCMICGQKIGTWDGQGTSHGYCDTHFQEAMREAERYRESLKNKEDKEDKKKK